MFSEMFTLTIESYHHFYLSKWFDFVILNLIFKMRNWISDSWCVPPTLWQWCKWHYLSTLVQSCVNVGTLVGSQCSNNIQTMLLQRCGNICHNIVTTLPECCSLVGFQCWTQMFIQCSCNIAWTLCEHCNIISFSML